ncbi:TolB family protein [Aneurinibacillus uraniidurans]|uniref:TolB family protein n=1 Tax=Aneurinibacillus uraniidurans TaxID=2966586 RepID=UPI00234B9A01|nr:hypothetical protein [Aneurinibacillus sp. B1]WCN36398.1 hypothetical protein PO771_10910 [Aneurinibacillus sp. B1]
MYAVSFLRETSGYLWLAHNYSIVDATKKLDEAGIIAIETPAEAAFINSVLYRVTGTEMINLASYNGWIGGMIDGDNILAALMAYPKKYPATWNDRAVYPHWGLEPDSTKKEWRKLFEPSKKSRWMRIGAMILLFTFFIGCGQSNSSKVINGLTMSNITYKRGYYNNPVWSPDGEKIAYNYDGSIWIMDSDRSLPKELLKGDDFDRILNWDKSQEILYCDADPSKRFGWDQRLRRIDIRNLENKILAEDLPIIGKISRNPHQSNELLVSMDDEDWRIYLYDVDSHKKTEIIEGYESAWSPDGKVMAYADSGVYVYDFVTHTSKLLYKVEKEGDFTQSLTWSPDGRWIAYRGGPSGEKNGIYIVPRDGSSPPEHILNYDVAELDWSPKGDKIVFSTVGGPGVNEMYVLNVPEKYRPKK